MSARRRGMPWVLAVVVLILVAFATGVPRVCRDASDSMPALSDVSAVAVATLGVSDPCGDAAAGLDIISAAIALASLVAPLACSSLAIRMEPSVHQGGRYRAEPADRTGHMRDQSGLAQTGRHGHYDAGLV